MVSIICRTLKIKHQKHSLQKLKLRHRLKQKNKQKVENEEGIKKQTNNRIKKNGHYVKQYLAFILSSSINSINKFQRFP